MEYHVLTPITILLRTIESFSQMLLICVIANKQVKSKKFLTGSLIFLIIYESFSMFLPQYLKGIATTILAISITYFVFKATFFQSIITYIIAGAITGVVDCIVSLSIVKIFSLNSFQDIINSQRLYIIGFFSIYFIILLIARIIYIYKKRDKNKKGLYAMTTIGLVNYITTFVLLLPNLVMILYYHDGKDIPLLIIIINICAIIAMFFVSTYNTRKGFELATTEQELITQRTYNKTLQNLVDGLRTFKHDYNNTLQTIYGYIQLNNMTGLKKFFDQILDESKAITALDKLNPELFKNPSLFGLVTAKYEYSRQNKVTLDFEIYGELENLDIQIYDFTRILGIFLDNAIEASAGSDKKKVNFLVSERKGIINIEISNTYSDMGLRVEEMEAKGVSSKGENRGLGLYKVKEILGKYPDIRHTTTANGGMFMQKLEIKKLKILENTK